MVETSIVFLIPESEALVGSWRDRYDASATDGMPAHVTVIFPFLTPERITPRTHTELETIFRDIPAFDATFAATARFDDRVLFLQPDPAEPFLTAIRRVAEDIGTPPYRATIPLSRVKPHLTVVGAHPEVMDEADEALRAGLPVTSRVTEAWLMQKADGGRWEKVRPFALG